MSNSYHPSWMSEISASAWYAALHRISFSPSEFSLLPPPSQLLRQWNNFQTSQMDLISFRMNQWNRKLIITILLSSSSQSQLLKNRFTQKQPRSQKLRIVDTIRERIMGNMRVSTIFFLKFRFLKKIMMLVVVLMQPLLDLGISQGSSGHGLDESNLNLQLHPW